MVNQVKNTIFSLLIQTVKDTFLEERLIVITMYSPVLFTNFSIMKKEKKRKKKNDNQYINRDNKRFKNTDDHPTITQLWYKQLTRACMSLWQQ